MTGFRTSTWVAGAVVAVVLVGAGTVGITAAAGLGGGEARLTGSELDQASLAALAEVGPGTVTDAERGPAAAPYAIDTRLPNGVEVAVELDHSFAVVWVSLPGWTGDAASGLEPRALTPAELASVDRTTAGQAALAEVGSGTVTDFRRSTDLDHAFAVEVTLADGTKRVIKLTERSLVVRVDRPTAG